MPEKEYIIFCDESDASGEYYSVRGSYPQRSIIAKK
jgi:hypothetical protein